MLNRLAAAAFVALGVLALGFTQIVLVPVDGYLPDGLLPTLAIITTAGLVMVGGRWPGLALAGLWLLLGLQMVTGTPLLVAQIAVGFIAFACSAWGSRATMWAALASIPPGALGAVLLTFGAISRSPWEFWSQLRRWGLADAALTIRNAGWGWQVVLGIVVLLLLVVPWLAGLAVRLRRASDDSARQQVAAEAERDAAAEVARLREAQTQLARDVHDVVGHSLTVILAQAEAGQYQRDSEALHRTLGTIAETARVSLNDVRRVLDDTGSHRLPPAENELDTLLDGVRAGGREVRFTEEGASRPLPPDRASVAHRVLQEMLTNAVRHGRPDAPILVERHWAGDLRIEVSNSLPLASEPAAGPAAGPDPGPDSVGDAVPGGNDLTAPIRLGELEGPPPVAASRPERGQPRAGHGLPGMRRRLEAVGGRLDVRRREEQGTFTVTAWIPLPGRLEQQ